MAEVSGLHQAVVLVNEVGFVCINKERVLCEGPPTGVYVKRSDDPGFRVYPRNPHVQFNQSLRFKIEQYVKALDDWRASVSVPFWMCSGARVDRPGSTNAAGV